MTPFCSRPFEKLAASIHEHCHGILAYFDSRLTQGPIEAINGIIQLAKRRARGFRNLTYRAIAYWVAGKLTLNLTPFSSTGNNWPLGETYYSMKG